MTKIEKFTQNSFVTALYALRMTALDSTETGGPLSGVDNMYPENNPLIADFCYVPGKDYARKETSFGYIVEGRVPWENIFFPADNRGTVQPDAGNVFGMAIMNHENERQVFYCSIEWASEMQDAVWNTVIYHDSMAFLENHVLKMSTENVINGVDTGCIDYRPRKVKVTVKPTPTMNDLLQNYSNPSNSSTTIEFLLPSRNWVTLKLFDLNGAEIGTFAEGMKETGRHTDVFHAENLPSGVYLYRLSAGNFTKKMTIIKSCCTRPVFHRTYDKS